MSTVVIPMEGTSCLVCAARVKKTLAFLAGFGDVEVSLAERNSRVHFQPRRTTPDRIVAAINERGCRAGSPMEVKGRSTNSWADLVPASSTGLR